MSGTIEVSCVFSPGPATFDQPLPSASCLFCVKEYGGAAREERLRVLGRRSAMSEAKAQMTKARLETLFEAGSFMVAFKVGGDASVYCFIFSNHSLAINLQK